MFRDVATLGPVLLQRLRAETRDIHAELELQLPLMNPALSIEDYKRLAARFYGYYVPVERLFETNSQPDALLPPSSAGTKSRWLLKDLRSLGYSEPEIQGLPLCDVLPDATSPGALFGIAYVLEGATLGGQIITKHLQKILPLSPDNGCRFFAGYGPETGNRWKAFLVTMEEGIPDAASQDAAVDAAVETFTTMRNWLFKQPD